MSKGFWNSSDLYWWRWNLSHSTTKSMYILFYLLKVIIKAAYAIHFEVGNRLLYTLFTRPLYQRKRKIDAEYLSKSNQHKYDFEGQKIHVYEFGNGVVPVLLIHGWRGHAGNFNSVIKSLNLYYYKIIAFDAPAHNKSGGSTTDFFQITRLTKELVNYYKPHFIIAHSMGSAIAVTALSELPDHTVLRLVLLSIPSDLRFLVNSFTQHFNISSSIKSNFEQYVQIRLKKSFEASRIDKLIKNLYIPILLIHDRTDKVLPFVEAEKISLKYGATMEFVALDSVGHYKMLHDLNVLQKTRSFIVP